MKPFFDDAAQDDHSTKLYGHVTTTQFRQCLSTKLQMHLSEQELAIVINKFVHEDKPELVRGQLACLWLCLDLRLCDAA